MPNLGPILGPHLHLDLCPLDPKYVRRHSIETVVNTRHTVMVRHSCSLLNEWVGTSARKGRIAQKLVGTGRGLSEYLGWWGDHPSVQSSVIDTGFPN